MRILLLAAWLAGPAAAAPALQAERVVLRTPAGDLVVALYAGAPRHAAKLLGLFRAGAYDGAPVTKVDPSRFIAFGGVKSAAIKRLPVETGGGPHRAGVVAMAHAPGDPDESGTAFVILFADIPAMDGRFTAVGELAGGREVLEALKSFPVGGDARPAAPLALSRAEVFASADELAKTVLRGPDSRALGRDAGDARRRILLGLAALAPAAGAALWRSARSPALLVILSGFFAAFAALADLSAYSAPLSIALFAATVGVFRLMGRFER